MNNPRPMLLAEAIRDPAVRAAALRFERETGRRLADNLGPDNEDEFIELFLILNGFPADRSGPTLVR